MRQMFQCQSVKNVKMSMFQMVECHVVNVSRLCQSVTVLNVENVSNVSVCPCFKLCFEGEAVNVFSDAVKVDLLHFQMF